MQQVTVGGKYQVVIPKEVRKKIKGLKPGSKVSVYNIDEEAVAIRMGATSWVERTAGIAREAWRNIDPIAELEKMRDEWEERLKEIGKNLK